MNIDANIRSEWFATHTLSGLSCHWLRVHNPEMADPIGQAISVLRSTPMTDVQLPALGAVVAGHGGVLGDDLLGPPGVQGPLDQPVGGVVVPVAQDGRLAARSEAVPDPWRP